MIYSPRVNFSLAGCPIHFAADPDAKQYPLPGRYVPPIGESFLLQLSGSADLFPSGGSPLIVVRVISASTGGWLRDFNVQRQVASRNGTVWGEFDILLSGFPDRMVYFEVVDSSTGEVLADSGCYRVVPARAEEVAHIRYTHRDNELDTRFIENATIQLEAVGPGLNNAFIQTPEAGEFEGRTILDTLTPSESSATDVQALITGPSGEEVVIPMDTVPPGGGYSRKDLTPYIRERGLYSIEVFVRVSGSSNPWSMTRRTGFPVLSVDSHIVRQSWFDYWVEGGMKPNQLEVLDESEDYMDQNYTNSLIFSRPYTTERLTMGGPTGLPAWQHRQLAYIFACPYLEINGMPYRRASGAKLEKEDAANTGMVFSSIDVQPTVNYIQIDKVRDGVSIP